MESGSGGCEAAREVRRSGSNGTAMAKKPSVCEACKGGKYGLRVEQLGPGVCCKPGEDGHLPDAKQAVMGQPARSLRQTARLATGPARARQMLDAIRLSQVVPGIVWRISALTATWQDNVCVRVDSARGNAGGHR